MLEELRTPLAVTAGAVVGLGVLLLIMGLRGGTRPDDDSVIPHRRHRGASLSTRVKYAALGLLVGAVVLAVTKWLVLAVALGLLVALWQKLFGGAGQEREAITRVEGLAAWIEALRDTIAGAVGLEQAIPATAINAAPSVRPSLNVLVDRLRVREPLPDALMKFAEDLDDPSADLVVAALILNAKLRGPGLRDVLTALAASSRDELDVRRRVESSRRSTRRSVQVVVGVISIVAAVLVVFNQAYMAPYATFTGQLVLAVVLGIFALSVLWLRRLAGVSEAERFLVGATAVPRATRGAGR